eukprot:scaffold154269_cov15-Tisochrysis_lutea.AAC.2
MGHCQHHSLVSLPSALHHHLSQATADITASATSALTQLTLLCFHTNINQVTAGITASGTSALETATQAASTATASAAASVGQGQAELARTLSRQHATNVAMTDALMRMNGEAAEGVAGVCVWVNALAGRQAV